LLAGRSVPVGEQLWLWSGDRIFGWVSDERMLSRLLVDALSVVN
jgi:hypothetical protein